MFVAQVTIRIARDFAPKKITGVDIDGKLVTIAWKVLHRQASKSCVCECVPYVPLPLSRYFVSPVAPDGTRFPASLVMSRGPTNPSPSLPTTKGPDEFPNNIHFCQVCAYAYACVCVCV